MGSRGMAMLLFQLIAYFTSGAVSAPCLSDTVVMNITSTADVQNLTDALACVGQGIFDIAWHSSVTIDERIEMSDGKNVTVTGSGFPNFDDPHGDDSNAGVIIDAASGAGIFSVSNGSTLRLSNIGLEGGNSKDGGAVAVLASSALFVFGCTFTRNHASNGGVIYAESSTVGIDGSAIFINNMAGDIGGVIYAESSTVGIDGSAIFTNNTAGDNGGVIYASLSTVDINGNATFTSNTAGEDGGSVYADSSIVSFHGNIDFSSNYAGDRGGVMYARSSKIGIDGNAMFTDNSAAENGGAIYARSSEVDVDGTTIFTNNVAEDVGGAMYAGSSSNFTFRGFADFASNYASDSGGAIYARSSQISIDGNSAFTNNSALRDGGVMYADSSNVSFNGNTEVSSNHAVRRAGVLYARGSDIVIDGNASFTNNVALSDGGVMFESSSTVSLNGNTQFSGNYAGVLGGVIHGSSSEIDIGGNASFTNNSAAIHGGAVYATQCNVSLQGNTHFSSNRANEIGGAIVAWESSEISLDINATFTRNYATVGGAISVSRSKIVINGNALFTHNSAGGIGGAIYAATVSKVSIDGNAVFTNNFATDTGGAINAIGSGVCIDGDAMFTSNSAGRHGGALEIENSNITIKYSKNPRDDLSGNEGGVYCEAGGDCNYVNGVVFVNNSAVGLGGALRISRSDEVHMSNVKFTSNQASLGGAFYMLAVDDKQAFFSECVLEDNTAEDGGAIYLNTGPGVDIFTSSVFRNNFAETSGGAIFHTGSLRVSNTTFVANKAGIEGPAVMSVGFLEELSDVSFTENNFFCRVGEYGYIDKNESTFTQDGFCRPCFEEACSRCSSVGNGLVIREDVRIDGKPVCEKPPVGSTATSSGTTVANLKLEKGYFRTSNQSHAILRCYRERACKGGQEVDKYCSDGYKGAYCAVCETGFAPGIAYSCRKCSAEVTRWAKGVLVAVGLALIIIAGLLVSHLHDGAEASIESNQSLWKNKCRPGQSSLVKMLPVRAIKMVVTVWQIISQFDAVAGDVYPDLYQTFVSKVNPLNLDLDFAFSYSCLVSNDFYDHLVFATITPLLALALLAASFFIARKRNSRSESAMREVRHKHEAVALFIAFIVYSPVSYRIFRTFACDELEGGDTYLRADYRLLCSTSRHDWYKVYAFIMVGVYPIGIAAAFAGLLSWHRRDLVKPGRGTVPHLKPLQGIWSAYKPSRYYYEVVECGRRIALTVIATFVLPDSTAQLSLALLVAVAYVFVSEVLSPFQKSIDAGLYRWGNGIIVASMYVAFLKKVDVGQDTASTEYLLTFSGVLIAANVFMVVTVLMQTVLLGKEVHAMKNAVRARDIPVRRTHFVSLGGLRTVNEDDVWRDGGGALESQAFES